MSPELLAALVGAGAGGIIALFGGIAQAFIQGWISERGKITNDVAAWSLYFTYGVWSSRESSEQGKAPPGRVLAFPWEVARTYTTEPSPADSREMVRESNSSVYTYDDSSSYYTRVTSANFRFTSNFVNTKGTNAAVLEYSVQFFNGKQALLTLRPLVENLSPGQALALPAENVAGFRMHGELDIEESKKVLSEADRAEFTARLSSGPPIRVELEHLSQDPKGAQKGDAT